MHSPVLFESSGALVPGHLILAQSLWVSVAFMVAVLILFGMIGWQRWRKARRMARMRQREIEQNTPRRLRKKMGD